jgi:TRAP-type C4-dicarboxylate transport system substrate-binding protein
MKGLKIRVPDAPLYTLFPKAVGANPTPIAFAEVYLALQNKTVDAQENPLPTIDAKKFYEVQSHINITAHITDALLTIIGGPLWAKLSDADKKTFQAVFQEAASRATGEIIESEKRLMTDFAKRGKTVVMVDRKPFMAAVQKFYSEGKLPDGGPLPWPTEMYQRVQAIK